MTAAVRPEALERALRAGLVLLAALAWALIFPWAATHTDLARDVVVAQRLAQGVEYPLLGPVLAGALHLGPVWYWLLAALLAAGCGWSGVVAAIAMLGALQFSFAYLAGKALHSRRAGLLWVALLLLPSWSNFETVFPQHTTLTASTTLATVLAALRYWRGGKSRYLLAAALAATLAVHAHPSTAGLAFVGGLLALLAWRRGRLAPPLVAGCLLLVLAPFAPMFWAQWSGRFDLGAALGTYYAGVQSVPSLAALPALLWASLVGGAGYWAGSMLGLGSVVAGSVMVILATLFALGGLGFLVALRQPDFRRVGIAAVGCVALVALVTVLLRANHPYYMTTALRVLALGLVAAGLAQLAMDKPRIAVAAAFMLALPMQLLLVAGVAAAQVRGALPFAVLPLGDVKAAPMPVAPLALLPAYAVARSAQAICAGQPLAAHGPWGSQLLHDYAIGVRLACPGADLVVGGDDADRAHWLGLPRAMLRSLRRTPQQSLGPIGLLPVRQVFGAPLAEAVGQGAPAYPPLAPASGAPSSRQWSLRLAPGDSLAVTHLGFVLAPGPQLALTLDGRPQPVAARDKLVTVWRCGEHCSGGDALLSVDSAEHARVDIVLF